MPVETSHQPTDHESLRLCYISSWLWRAVAALVETKEFIPNPQWIAKKLNVSDNEVITALKGLERLAIIKPTANGYKKLLKNVYFSDRDLNPQKVLGAHIGISLQILEQLNGDFPKKGSFYRTGFVATTEAIAQKYFAKLEAIMKEFLMESANCHADSVYSFTFSAVDLFNQSKQGSQQ